MLATSLKATIGGVFLEPLTGTFRVLHPNHGICIPAIIIPWSVSNSMQALEQSVLRQNMRGGHARFSLYVDVSVAWAMVAMVLWNPAVSSVLVHWGPAKPI